MGGVSAETSSNYALFNSVTLRGTFIPASANVLLIEFVFSALFSQVILLNTQNTVRAVRSAATLSIYCLVLTRAIISPVMIRFDFIAQVLQTIVKAALH